MGAAFGGASAQVFGGRGAGNILTRATAICAATFMITSVALASMSGGEDRALKAKAAQEESKKKDRGTVREKTAPSASSSAAAPPSAPAPASDAEAPKP
jgi:preprotein translocase subunit SecG